MARVTQRAVQCIVVVDVAIGAKPRRHRVRSCQLETGGRVVKRSVSPQHGVMTRFAGSRKTCRHVRHRSRRIVVVRQVARDACRASQVVVVVDVAVRTLPRRHGVRTGQRESHGRMVESRVRPTCCVVAGVTSLREIRGHVIRIRRPLVIRQMAGHAGRAVQRVVVVDVTVRTLSRRYGVSARQRKSGVVVVKRRIHPVDGVMACLAGLREVGGNVIRVRSVFEISQVTGDAGCAVQRVIVVDVAVGAQPGRHGVHASQRKSGGGVIEASIGPLHRVVALLASGRESGMRHRSRCRIVVILVATDARRDRDVVVVVDMAVRALPRRNRMRTGQRKS